MCAPGARCKHEEGDESTRREMQALEAFHLLGEAQLQVSLLFQRLCRKAALEQRLGPISRGVH